jgi:hypothetical protein
MAIQRQRLCGVSRLPKIASTIVLLLNGLSSLMICTHNLTVLTLTKEMTCYCESFGYGGATLSETFLTI